ncbi:MAG: serine/threonine-protein kinase [Planctomycetota bacterium]
MASEPGAPPRDIIPGFEIVSLLGRGGMGAVYRATKRNIGKEVALKVLLPSLAEDPVTAARFDREVRALARIRHEGLVNVLDAGEAPPYRYMVLDLVDGEDLQRRVERDGPLAPDTVASIARQVLVALDHVHGLGIVHRDIKPANLILEPGGRVRLCDLGLVRLVDENSQLTQRLLLGTPEYVSPEQVRGDADLDLRSDLYSLGATLWFLLCGAPPFTADTPMATAQLHLTARPQKLARARPDLPAGLEALVEGLLEKRPERRPQSPRAALALLDGGARQARRLPLLRVAVALVLAGAFAAGLASRFGPPAPPPPPGDAGEVAADPAGDGSAPADPRTERAALETEYRQTLDEWSTVKAMLSEVPQELRVTVAGRIQALEARLAAFDRRLSGAGEERSR